MVGRQLPFFSLHRAVLADLGLRRLPRRCCEVWPAILVAGVTFAIPQYLVSNFHGPWLVDVVAAIVSMACLALFLRVWQPQTVMDRDAARLAGRDASTEAARAPATAHLDAPAAVHAGPGCPG